MSGPRVRFTAEVPAGPEVFRALREMTEAIEGFAGNLESINDQLADLRQETAQTKEDLMQQFDGLKGSVAKLGEDVHEAVGELSDRPTAEQVGELKVEVDQEVAELEGALHPTAAPPAEPPPAGESTTPEGGDATA